MQCPAHLARTLPILINEVSGSIRKDTSLPNKCSTVFLNYMLSKCIMCTAKWRSLATKCSLPLKLFIKAHSRAMKIQIWITRWSLTAINSLRFLASFGVLEAHPRALKLQIWKEGDHSEPCINATTEVVWKLRSTILNRNQLADGPIFSLSNKAASLSRFEKSGLPDRFIEVQVRQTGLFKRLGLQNCTNCAE